FAACSFVNAAAYFNAPINVYGAYPNATEKSWSGIKIQLVSPGVFVNYDNISSDKFNFVLAESSDRELVFFGGEIVNPGDAIVFDFANSYIKAEIESNGLAQVNYQFIPTPVVPEPATMAMLGLGGLAVLRKRVC
ncbi:MAG: PEP-CTERM sorting domain-containing protein, partial [Sedimentisphaerales bacterium]|nr:PEP-CTERM sorting domain-containing protein [Sedimentisphaerales bacterium]